MSSKNEKIRKGLVLWYSQTGNTEKIGRSIAWAWEKEGLAVDSGDYRDIDNRSLNSYDIIAAGTPVYYYQVPSNFREWLEDIPSIDGISVAAFVTFGGEGGNQHNTVCELTDLLASKGGIPAGTAEFSSMISWCVTWPFMNTKQFLRYSDRPGIEAFTAAEKFAAEAIVHAAAGESVEVSGRRSFLNIIKGKPSIGFTKLLITGHRVDTDKCIQCGICRKACPVNAISPENGIVESERCIACLGCINKCPAGAVKMNFIGREVYGHSELFRKNRIATE